MEDAEREKWLRRLADLLDDVGAPSYEAVRDSKHPASAMRLLSGGMRPATLRARVRAGERFFQWLQAFRGRRRVEVANDLTDYLAELLGRPCGRRVLKATWAILKYLESVGGFPMDRCFTESGLTREIYEVHSPRRRLNLATSAGVKLREFWWQC